MKRELKIFASILLSLTLFVPLISCGAKRDADFEKSYATSFGTAAVKLSRYDADGKRIADETLEKDADDCAAAAEAQYLRYTSSDDLSAVNAEVDTVFDCDAEFISSIQSLIELSGKTDGAYDPCCGAYTGLFADGEPSEEAAASALSAVGADMFSFSETTVFKSNKSAKIDVGAAALGYAFSAAADFLKGADSRSAAFVSESAVYVRGYTSEDGPYNVGITADGTDKCSGYFRITDGFVFFADGERDAVYALGKTVDDNLKISKAAVFSSDALTAAVTSQAAVTAGSDALSAMYDSFGRSFEAAYSKPDGSLTVTEGAENTIYTPETEASGD